MQIGDLLFDEGKVYLVKAFLPRYPKRIWLLELETGRQFSLAKSIAKHWKPDASETQKKVSKNT
jgi:hypothetical protein